MIKIKILALVSVLTIFTACEREDIYDFMEGHTRPLLPEIKVTRSAGALFNNDAFTVTIKAKTGAVIEYRTDGTDPTPGTGTVYTGPFDLATAGTHLIKAIGHIDLEVSVVSSKSVTVGDGGGLPYEIATAAQLNNIRAPHLVDNFIQTANIDLSAYSSGEGWMPIGTSGTPFAGSYDGNGYVITGLKINKPTVSGIGLFGEINAATLSNIALQGINVNGDGNVAGLAGFAASSSTISNCSSSGSVTGNSITGGLVGNLLDSTISDSYSSCIVTGGSSSGGLAGRSNAGTITRSYATGNVTNTGDDTGGLIGAFDGATGAISQSFAKGNVTGVNNTGGLIGDVFNIPINNCYATGEVTASGTSTGGLVGSLGNTAAATINNSYSTGKVTGAPLIGGLLGELDAAGAVNNSFWDTGTSTLGTSGGGTEVGQSTIGMKTEATFTAAGWDFGTIWTIQEGVSYPYFQWQGAANIPY